jgi:aryl sulfotransferase
VTGSSTGPSTVWLASYPKAGNTWIRAVLHALTRPTATRSTATASGPDGHALPRPPHDPDIDLNAIGSSPIASCRWPLDALLGFASSDLTPDEIDELRPACDTAADAQLEKTCFRKIHDGLFTGPGATPIVAPTATRAAAYLVRDPRDVAVSFAHFSGRSPAWAVARMATDSAALADNGRTLTHQVRQRLGTWSQHVDGWTGHALFPVATVRYEDLHANPVGEFRRLAEFAGLTVSRDQVTAAVTATRFDRLRAQEAQRGFRERPAGVSTFFRRGVVGAWRDELPTDLARRIESDHGATMARLGYLT